MTHTVLYDVGKTLKSLSNSISQKERAFDTSPSELYWAKFSKQTGHFPRFPSHQGKEPSGKPRLVFQSL